jgi:hypothetical protein
VAGPGPREEQSEAAPGVEAPSAEVTEAAAVDIEELETSSPDVGGGDDEE